jgi:ABC-type transport system involved in multi-copper enzyme maturation permease subunit
LTTPLTAGQIWLGKLLASLRVSSALTSFLIWPLLCAVVLRMSDFGRSAGTLVAYLVIIAMTCLSTCSIGLFCSTVFSRTSISITVSYGILLGIYTVLPGLLALSSQGVGGAASAGGLLASTSPYWVVFRLPLTLSDYSYTPPDSLLHLVTFVLVAILLNGLLAAGSIVNLAARSRLLRSS